jgi:integrase
LGRNRKKAFQKLPKYVYWNRCRYVYRPPGSKNIVLGNITIPEIWDAVSNISGNSKETLDYIASEYFKGLSFAKLADPKERKRLLNVVLDTKAKGRFGNKLYRTITPGVIRKYLDYKGTPAANREIAALSAAWSYCYERDIVTVRNPCKGVKRIKETPRTRLVTESEYKAVYKLAPDYIKVAMELAYLCRMRRSEVLDVRCKDIESDGLNTRRIKGSDSTLTLWSDRLKAAINLGLRDKIRVPDMLMVTFRNTTIRGDTFSKRFNKLIKDAGVEPFTFHDLKAAGVSDFDGDKKVASGHKSERMVAVYDRKRKSVKPTD